MKSIPLSKAFEFIEPGPLCLLSTFSKGHYNVMPMTWTGLIDFDPVISCVVSPANLSFKYLRQGRDCVLAIPGVDLAKSCVQMGNCSGDEVDKFMRFHLTTTKAKKVKAKLINECLYNLECKVIDSSMSSRYGLFILKGLVAYKNEKRKEKRTFHARGDGVFFADGEKFDLRKFRPHWP